MQATLNKIKINGLVTGNAPIETLTTDKAPDARHGVWQSLTIRVARLCLFVGFDWA